MPRTLVYDNKKMGSVWEVIKERECDPHPGKYSLWNPGNGAIHSEVRDFDNRIDLDTYVNKHTNMSLTLGWSE